MQLSVNISRLEDAVAELIWWPFNETHMTAWDEHQQSFAAELGADDWQAVSQCAIELGPLHQRLSEAPGNPDGALRHLRPETADLMVPLHADAIRAYNVLRELADETEVIEPRDPPEAGSRPDPLDGVRRRDPAK